MTAWLKKMRRWFRGDSVRTGQPLNRQAAAEKIWILVRCFYAVMFFFAVRGFLELEIVSWDPREHDLLWPVVWVDWVGWGWGRGFVLVLYLFGSLGAVWNPESRALRVAAWLGVFWKIALDNSFGKIGHSMHLWVLVAFVWIFLPASTGMTRRQWREQTLQIWWWAQAWVLLTYTLSGVGKVSGIILQTFQGEVTALHPNALALHVADRLIQTHSTSLVGEWLIYHSFWGWPFFVGAIYLQFFSLWIAFRPAVQREWAVGLIFFHLFVMLSMTIDFSTAAVVLAILIIGSPLIPEGVTWRDKARALPLASVFLKRFL